VSVVRENSKKTIPIIRHKAPSGAVEL